LLTGDEYTMYLKEAYFNPRQEKGFATNTSKDYIPEIAYNKAFSEYDMYNDNTDWRKAVQQFGETHDHYIALSGGGEKANFRISGGYHTETGTAIKQKFDRYTTRVALDYFVSDRIKVASNFDLTYYNNKKNHQAYGDLLGIALKKMPNLSIYEEENGRDTDRFYTMNPFLTKEEAGFNAGSGKFSNYDLLNDQYALPNPVAIAHLARLNEKIVQLRPEFILSYDILGTEAEQHRLKYEGQIRFDIRTSNTDSFFPGSILSSNWSDNNYNSASSSSYKSHGLSTRHTLTFTPHFNNEGHSLLFLARFEYGESSSSSQNLGNKWLPTTDAHIVSPSAGGVNTGFGSGAGEGRSENFLFQLHYAWKGKYVADVTLRRDGSTRFGPSKRWGNFPGVSFRWNISDEPWMERVKWISMLSIRPGWGIVGNSPGQEGLYYSKYAAGGNYLDGAGVHPSNIRLTALKWEEKETWNLGFD
ncbi:MAG: SusC/RagA family TonB-linked outer membrane protein, partial [Bacteroidaceae bacterium]|nr:SusC/RagA family TonB-linked outer membrane protein [Bacteroidaceae bacterium]